MNNNHHGGGFMNGFLWGAIIGSLAVFLLGTKKGKNILKLISEESFELSELFGGEEDEEESPKEKHNKCAHCKEKAIHNEPQIVEVQNSEPENENGEVKPASPPASPRRFFRGIPKKS